VTVYTRDSPTRPVSETGQWFSPDRMAQTPVTTITRKALALVDRSGRPQANYVPPQKRQGE
jgi:hypothetical protein